MTCVVDGVAGPDRGAVLLGIITDGDLRRHMDRVPQILDLSAGDVMTRNPVSVPRGTLAAEALSLMEQRKITSIVVAEAGEPRRGTGDDPLAAPDEPRASDYVAVPFAAPGSGALPGPTGGTNTGSTPWPNALSDSSRSYQAPYARATNTLPRLLARRTSRLRRGTASGSGVRIARSRVG
jgi:CBS domain-containing protein